MVQYKSKYLGPGEHLASTVKKDGEALAGQGQFPGQKATEEMMDGNFDAATYEPVEVPGKSHGLVEDIAVMAARANVKKLVLTHYPPFEVKIQETRDRIHGYYKGEVIFGQDMLEISA
jgi:L-ascorbate metabolism protein UlaG (beta-lactamase superfamily)